MLFAENEVVTVHGSIYIDIDYNRTFMIMFVRLTEKMKRRNVAFLLLALFWSVSLEQRAKNC